MSKNVVNATDMELAQKCGMTLAQWQATRQQATAAKSRGRARKRRPESSLWDPVEGQAELFETDTEE